jgi:hypothetical protein
MNDKHEPPLEGKEEVRIQRIKAPLIINIVVAILAAAGALGGAYLGSPGKSSLPIPQRDHQFELWSPMIQDAKNLIVFKYDKVTGQTWRLVEATGGKTKEWDLVIDP